MKPDKRELDTAAVKYARLMSFSRPDMDPTDIDEEIGLGRLLIDHAPGAARWAHRLAPFIRDKREGTEQG